MADAVMAWEPPPLPGQPARITLVRLSSKDPRSWSLMPHLLERARAWGIRFGQGEVETVLLRLQGAFVLAGTPEMPVETVGCWVAVEEPGDRIVGHVLAVQDVFAGRTVVMLSQMVIDPRVVPQVIVDMATQEVEAWAASLGAGELMMLARHFPRPTGRTSKYMGKLLRWLGGAWFRHYGFEPYRLLMRKPLATAVTEASQVDEAWRFKR